MTKNNQGIALIQILLITAILSVFALYITQAARQQVKMASWSQDRALAEVTLHSAQAEIIFALLTENKMPDANAIDTHPLIKKWNFHGEKFQINNNVTAAIQDQAALINLHFIHQGRFLTLLQNNGVSEQRSMKILDRLLDWQDTDTITRAYGYENPSNINKPRNGPIPDVSELNHALTLTDDESKLIFQNTGIFFFGDFNPMTASLKLISALSSPEAALRVDELRRSKGLTRAKFIEATGIIEDDDMRFYPSNVLAITYQVTINNAVVTKQQIVALSPYAQNVLSPLNILLNRS